jgi:RNA-dependent RNA polymerase
MQGAVLVELTEKGGFTTNKPRSLEFTIVLQKHKFGRSNRVLRKFGSRRVLQVSVPSGAIQRNSEALREFFSNKFVLNGSVFEAVCAKDHTVYLLETSDYDPSGSGLATWSHISNQGRVSLFDFMQWHNPIVFNSTQASLLMPDSMIVSDPYPQTFSKWAARFSLAFSTSVPACRLMPSHMIRIPDIQPSEGCPDRCIMTDGCGFMNRAGADCICAPHLSRIVTRSCQLHFIFSDC